jgi:flagellar biosynthetic protein FliR
MTLLTENELMKLVFIFFRIIGVLVVCPIFGDRAVPSIVKVGLSVFISIMIYSVVPVGGPDISFSGYSIVLLILKEMLLGITIGLVVLFMFVGIQFGGEIVGFQMGLWLAETIDPNFGVETPVISHFQYLFAIMLFLSVNGHHIILKALKESFILLPLGRLTFSGGLYEEVIGMGGSIFRIGIQMAAPIIGVLLLISISMGLIARIIPELDILMIEVPLKIGIGLLFLAWALPFMASALLDVYKGTGNNIIGIFKLMSP